MDFVLNYIFLFIAFASYLKPAGFDAAGFDTINKMFNILRIVCAALICWQYIIKRQKISALVLSEITFFFVYIVLLFGNNSDINHYVIFGMSIITITMLIDYCIAKGQVQKLINVLFAVYFILIALNLYHVISVGGLSLGIYDGIVERSSFLSSANGSASYFFPALLIAGLYSTYRGKRYGLLSVVLILIIGATIFLLWSATAIIGYVIFVGIYIVGKNDIYQKNYDIKWFLGGAMLLNIAISFFRIHYLFSAIITKLLNKSISMTGRIKFWDIGIRGFWDSPIWGNGKEVYIIDNVLIRLLYQGGIILLFFFLIMFFIAVKKIVENNERTRITYLICGMLSVIVIMSIAEGWDGFMGLYIVLAIAYHSSDMELEINHIDKKEIKKRKRIRFVF